MAHSLSRRKRVRQNVKKRKLNRARKSMIKTQLKNFDAAIKVGDVEKASEQFKITQKRIDKVASSSTMHKNTAARIKSRMAKKLKALKAKSA